MAGAFLDFFVKHNLEDLRQVFIDNDFRNIYGLMELTSDDLKEMGIVSDGLRRSFLCALKHNQTEGKEVLSESKDDETNNDKSSITASNTEKEVLSESKDDETNNDKSSITASNTEKEVLSESKDDETNNDKSSITASNTASYFTPRRPSATKKRKSLFDNEEHQAKQQLITTLMGSPKLSDYPNARKSGMRIYSSAEIQKAKGFERQRLPHWNEMAERLAKDGLKKTAITGAIDFDWRLRKTELITNEGYSVTNKTIEKNKDRMLSAFGKVNTTASLVCKARLEKKFSMADDIETNELPFHFAELKKSQDAVIKSVQRAKTKEAADEVEEEELEDIDINSKEYREVTKEMERVGNMYCFNE